MACSSRADFRSRASRIQSCEPGSGSGGSGFMTELQAPGSARLSFRECGLAHAERGQLADEGMEALEERREIALQLAGRFLQRVVEIHGFLQRHSARRGLRGAQRPLLL